MLPSIDPEGPPAPQANGALDPEPASSPPLRPTRTEELLRLRPLPPPGAAPPGPNNNKRKPLPRWLHARIKASTLLSRSRRLGTGNVVVLPFNKIAKLGVPANEIAAMRLVRANTSIPVPEILEVHDTEDDGTAHIVMSQVPGEDLEDALHKMTDAQVKAVVKELAGYLQQLRRLDRDPDDGDKTAAAIIGGAGSTRGYDNRLGSSAWGPFATAAEFHTYVRFGEPLEHWSHEPDVVAVHGKPEGAYKVRFSHADIAPRNVRVDKGGRITGIIDWEFAGWYPEYWEYVRMFYPGERPYLKGWFDAIEEEVGVEKYKAERKAEEIIWARAGPFGYD
ncbi:hypothetical protein Daus18300_011217 [Diaporthe australafricana]|uniref:Aminoglycoside phosphotransferase domain-containing protein n=1 Tax=Diaporthe australafricana TaxID=127596 RepID=A0ABR3W7C8_9PEZI